MAVRFEKLTLSGFGRFRDEVTVSFGPGLNTLVADNEAGKSTLMAGLAAVIFGLPANSDPSCFGQERFRNWQAPARFTGELQFRAGKSSYRILRNFDNQRISLQRLCEDGWREEVGGEHRVGAKRPNIAYEEKIRELMGIDRREAFFATFFINQPLPEEDCIEPEIQELLSGAGTHYHCALDTLLAGLKSITRHTGKMGITSRDMHQDRRLEQLDREIAQIRQQLESARSSVDSLERLSQEIEEINLQRQRKEAERAAKARLLASWQEWRNLRDRYHEAISRQAGLSTASEKAAALDLSIRETEKMLAGEYAPFCGCSDDAGEALNRLAAGFGMLAVIEADLLQVETRCQSEEKEAAALASLLEGDLSQVRNRRELPAVSRALRENLAELKLLQEADGEMKTRIASLKESLLLLPDFSELGTNPSRVVEMLRGAVPAEQEKWLQINGQLAKLTDLSRERSKLYGVFDAALPEDLELYALYESRKRQVESALEAAVAARNAALKHTEELQAARRHFQKIYGDLDPLGDDAVDIVDRKLALLEAKLEQENTLRLPAAAKEHTAGSRPLAAALFAVLAGAGVFWVTGSAPVGILSALCSAALVYVLLGVVGKRRQLSLPQSRLGEINPQLRQVDTKLGSFARLREAELGELKARLRQRREEVLKLEQAQSRLPDDGEIDCLKALLEKAREEHSEFMENTKEARLCFGDVQAAFSQWQHIVRQEADLKERLAGLARLYSETAAPAELAGLPVHKLEAPWVDIASLAQISGAKATTLGDVLSWFGKQEAGWWDKVTVEASAYEAVRADIERLCAELEASGALGPDGLTRYRRLSEETARLRCTLLPFDEQTDPAHLEGLLQRCREAEDELTRRLSIIESLAGQRDELTARKERTQAGLSPLMERFSAVICSFSSPDEAVRAWHAFMTHKNRNEKDKKELAGILQAHGAADMAELRGKLADATTRSGIILKRWEDLQSAHPALPAGEEELEKLDILYTKLTETALGLDLECAQLYEAVREKELQLARLQGQTPISIAVSELRHSELLQERARLAREAAALELAYRELALAIEEFSSAYRLELADKANGYFRLITGFSSRSVVIDEQFSIRLSDDGKNADVSQLSQGAREQLYISLRLAVADLLSGNITLPFIFDDPFLNWDENRLQRVKAMLGELAEARQVVLLSHHALFGCWGNEIIPVTGGAK